jgi:hypothetical protein
LFCFNPSAALRRPRPRSTAFRHRPIAFCHIFDRRRAYELRRASGNPSPSPPCPVDRCSAILRPIAPPRRFELDLRRRASSAHHTSATPSPNSGKPTRLINFGRRRRPAAVELRRRAESKSSSTERSRQRQHVGRVPLGSSQ